MMRKVRDLLTTSQQELIDDLNTVQITRQYTVLQWIEIH